MDGDEEEKLKPKPVQKLAAEEQEELDYQLYLAVYDGDVGKAEELIKKGSNPNNTDNGTTPLIEAVNRGHESIVVLLLQHKADPNISTKYRYSPLIGAAIRGHESIVVLLLQHKADPNISNEYGNTPLIKAVREMHESIVVLLLQHKADPNIRNKDGYRPIHFTGSPEVADTLIKAGADYTVRTSNGDSVLHTTSWYGGVDVVEYFLKKGMNAEDRNKVGESPLHDSSSVAVAELLIKNGADVKAVTNDGDTVLHTAIRRDKEDTVDVVEYFIKKGLHVEVKNKFGVTPLHCVKGVKVAELLIREGAELTTVTNDEESVLHTACKNPYYDYGVVDFFVKKGLPVEQKNKFGETPLHSACTGDIARYLVSNGADLHSLTPDNNTVLHSAAKYGHELALEYFIDRGLSLKTQNKHGQTPIDILKQPSDDENVSERRKECLKLLKMRDLYTESDNDDSDGIRSNLSSCTKKDYIPLLMKAAEEGTVNTKWTNYSIGGASGAGKTSVFNLLVDNPPVLEHDSTPVVKPLPLCLHHRDDQMESHLIVSDKRCQWKTAEKDDLHRKLAECIQALGGVDAISSHGKEKAPRVPTTSSKQFSSTHTEMPTTCTSTDFDSSSSPISSSPISLITSVPSRIQPQACLAKSEATRKVLELLAIVKQAVELDQAHFIHLLDTGGQASFIDIAPALLRFNSVNIFVHKLNERLEDVANFYYSVQGAKIGEEHRSITNEELLSQLFSARRGIKHPEVNKSLNRNVHGEPHMLIVGTYFDDYERLEKEGKLQETIEEKNQRLLHTLDADKQVIVDYKPSKIIRGSKTVPETIFPLNAISRDDRTKEIAERIRKLASEAYMEAEIPVRWYLVQIDLNELKADKRDMVSIEEVHEKASVFAMNKEDIQAALQYFHDLTVCLYFHQVLPNIVFLSPECLFNKLSEIIAVSLGEHSGQFQRPVVDRLLVEGIFNITLFDSLPEGFNKDLFTVNDFLRLMKHLLVITPLSDGKHFFIPCVLRTCDNPMDDLEDCEVEPVVLKWKDAVRSGLFPSLAMALYQSKVTKIKAFESEEHVQFRNRLSFDCPDLEACLVLFELPKYIGITHTASAEDSPIVLDAVMKGIEHVVKSFEWKKDITHPKVGFLCKAQDSEQATFFYPNKNKSCLISHGYKKLPIDQQRHLSWFTKDVFSQVSRPQPEAVVPTRLELKKVFDILVKVSAEWDRIGLELGVSKNFREQLRKDISLGSDLRLESVLCKWIESETRPVTWDTVLDVLCKMERNDLAREVLQHIQ